MTYSDDILIARIRSLHSQIDLERQRMAVSRMNVEVSIFIALVTVTIILGGVVLL